MYSNNAPLGSQRPPDFPCKSMTLHVALRGRVYQVCDENYMKFAKTRARERILANFSISGVNPTLEQVNAALSEWEEKSSFATLDWLLEQMPPEDRATWMANYRFSPIHRSIIQKNH